MTLAEFLIVYRKKWNLSRTALAEELGIRWYLIKDWESGVEPTPYYLRVISKYFGHPIVFQYLMYNKDNQEITYGTMEELAWFLSVKPQKFQADLNAGLFYLVALPFDYSILLEEPEKGDVMTFVEFIEAYKEKWNLSRRGLAREWNIRYDRLGEWERGTSPSSLLIKNLEEYFECKIEFQYLLYNQDNQEIASGTLQELSWLLGIEVKTLKSRIGLKRYYLVELPYDWSILMRKEDGI